jgi:hypothetical protein
LVDVASILDELLLVLPEDPPLGFDPASGFTSTEPIPAFKRRNGPGCRRHRGAL